MEPAFDSGGSFQGELEEFLWGDSFWADGYFVESLGMVQEDMIRKYIKEQRDNDQSMPNA